MKAQLPDARAGSQIHSNVHYLGRQLGALNSNTVILPALSENAGGKDYADKLTVFRASGFADFKTHRQQSGRGILAGIRGALLLSCRPPDSCAGFHWRQSEDPSEFAGDPAGFTGEIIGRQACEKDTSFNRELFDLKQLEVCDPVR